jgi:hypothetical protein
MKKVVKAIIIGIIIILISLIFFDLHVLRGYFLTPYLYTSTFERFDGDMEYIIKDNGDGTLDLHLKNNSLAYYPIFLYRWEIFFDLSDSIMFQYYAARSKFSIDGNVLYDQGSGIDCGTGIGMALIRPLESFSLNNLKIQQVIQDYQSYNFIMALKEKGIDISSNETISCQLYLQINSLGVEEVRVYSNVLELPTRLFFEGYEREIADIRQMRAN